jgi:hypothetical protein
MVLPIQLRFMVFPCISHVTAWQCMRKSYEKNVFYVYMVITIEVAQRWCFSGQKYPPCTS